MGKIEWKKVQNADENFMYNLLLPAIVLIVPTVVVFFMLNSSGFLSVEKDGYYFQFGGAAAFYIVVLTMIYKRFAKYKEQLNATIIATSVSSIVISGNLKYNNSPIKNIDVFIVGTNSKDTTNEMGYYSIKVFVENYDKKQQKLEYTISIISDEYELNEPIIVPELLSTFTAPPLHLKKKIIENMKTPENNQVLQELHERKQILEEIIALEKEKTVPHKVSEIKKPTLEELLALLLNDIEKLMEFLSKDLAKTAEIYKVLDFQEDLEKKNNDIVDWKRRMRAFLNRIYK